MNREAKKRRISSPSPVSIKRRFYLPKTDGRMVVGRSVGAEKEASLCAIIRGSERRREDQQCALIELYKKTDDFRAIAIRVSWFLRSRSSAAAAAGTVEE